MQYQKTTAAISGVATRPGGSPPTPCPAANEAFKLVEGSQYSGQLPVATFSTDDKGRFYLELPVGTYCIVEAERPEAFTMKKNTAFETWDNSCRKRQWQLPLLVLSVPTTTDQNIKLDKHLPREEACLKKSAPHGKK